MKLLLRFDSKHRVRRLSQKIVLGHPRASCLKLMLIILATLGFDELVTNEVGARFQLLVDDEDRSTFCANSFFKFS